jgi:alkaline phosphatase D
MKIALTLLVILLFPFYLISQNVTHGPVIGGVTSNSIRMYARTNTPTTVEVQLSSSQVFTTFSTYNLTTSISKDNSAILTISNLSSNSKYFYRLKINGVQQGDAGSFTTFPTDGQDGNYTLLFGSCIDDTTSDAIFLEMQKHQCNLFLQTGDWIYSDVNNDPDKGSYFANDYYKIANEYHKKYSSVNMNEFMLHNPIDYVYDDHDFVNNNSTGFECIEFEITLSGVTPTVYTFPSYARSNAIKGYVEYFPSYTMVDTTQGIYHKITLGNIDIFVVDNRSARNSNVDALQEIGGNYYFVGNSSHTMLGKKQLNWLLTGLKNSTADWKIIATGVTFNKKYQDVRDDLLALPSLLGIPMGIAMMDGWAGYPMEQDSILNFIKKECVNNVVMISGDSHTSAIDDGSNAGMPEVMAANLHKGNSQLNWMIQYLLGQECWNSGAQGIGNTNFNNTFGKIETYQDDSLVMKVIDTYGTTIAKASLVNTKTLNASVDVDTIGAGKFSATATVNGGVSPYTYKWSTGATKKSVSGLTVGQYYVIVSDANGCTDSVDVPITGSVTAIAPVFEDEIYFEISPNPSRGKVHAEVKLLKSETILLELLNVEGQKIKEMQYSGSQTAILDADISSYDAGIYFVKLTAGEYSIVKRLLKVNY